MEGEIQILKGLLDIPLALAKAKCAETKVYEE